MCVCVCACLCVSFGVALCCVGGLFSVLFISPQISEESKGNRFHLILPSLSLSIFLSFFLSFTLLSLCPRQTALSLPQSECRHLPALSLFLSLPLFFSVLEPIHKHTHTRSICFPVSSIIKEGERGLCAILPFYSTSLSSLLFSLLFLSTSSPPFFLPPRSFSPHFFLCLYRQG